MGKQGMKRIWILLAIGAVLFMGTTVVSNLRLARFEPKTERDARFSNVLEQQAILKAGRNLIKAGDFEGALEKFNEALNAKYVKIDFDKTQAISSKADLYILWGKYTHALKEYDWVFERTPDHQYSMAKHKEILTLIEWGKTKNNQIIYDYISWLKNHFREQIPPISYKGYHTTVISTILRLYDTIGDYDAGIKFIDEILAYFRTGKAGDPKPGRVDAEYLKVREAFEAEKNAGGPTCKGQPNCIGSATKAIIQSDYFPW
jgi:tetratricopeptide (TPR) repeat protein